jgi:hypothetical protein
MPETFFKYHTAETAKIVLFNHSRRWSSPTLFNDPFDNDFSLHLTSDHTALAQRHVTQSVLLKVYLAAIKVKDPDTFYLIAQGKPQGHSYLGIFGFKGIAVFTFAQLPAKVLGNDLSKEINARVFMLKRSGYGNHLYSPFVQFDRL